MATSRSVLIPNAGKPRRICNYFEKGSPTQVPCASKSGVGVPLRPKFWDLRAWILGVGS